jgi:hypothetical protein
MGHEKPLEISDKLMEGKGKIDKSIRSFLPKIHFHKFFVGAHISNITYIKDLL